MPAKPLYDNATASIFFKLCEAARPDLLQADGSINHNALARASGLSQPTITRVLNASGNYSVSTKIAKKLAAVFDVTPAEIRAELPLNHDAITGMAAVEDHIFAEAEQLIDSERIHMQYYRAASKSVRDAVDRFLGIPAGAMTNIIDEVDDETESTSAAANKQS